jgi:hypothetical protein
LAWKANFNHQPFGRLLSQHYFSYQDYTILYGWDKPLQYYFLVISRPHPVTKEREYVFSNLDLENPAMSIEQIYEVLKGFEIPIPADLSETLINASGISGTENI